MTATAGIVFRLAWRNLWRNYRRTAIVLAAIVAGIWAMIFMIAFTRGMIESMVSDGIRSIPGHVQIHHPDFRNDPTVDNLMPSPGGELAAALGGEDVVAWSSRVRVPAVISSERGSRGVTLLGIDPVAEAPISFVADDIVEGRHLENERDRGLILGRRLLERIETDVGKRVVVMTQGTDNEVVDRGFRVVGVFESEIASTEEAFAFAGRAALQDLLAIGDQVSEIAVLGKNRREAEQLHRRLAETANAEVEVLPWYELNSYLGTTMRTMDGFVIVWIVVIFLALSFGFVNTLVMAVFERVREIGLMMALGMKPRTILAQIIAESLLLLAIGLAVGNILAWATIHLLSDGIDFSFVGEGLEIMGAASVLKPSLGIKDVLLSTAIVLGLGFVASLSPAIRASRYHPVAAITKE
ncbi:MAG: FtsX-like permease family protein [Albidovulum sp.]|nr:FtsX-like permease family protein [Albidovulum sp.]